MAQFQLVMRSGPNVGKSYPLEGQEIFVGRDVSNGIAINDAEVSRKHARLELRGSAYVIQDLGSTNGTFINGQRVSASGGQVLNPGDTVSFGEGIVLMVEAAFDPNATVISSSQAPKTVAPVRRPAPTPVPASVPAPVPAQAYSGQVPAGPVAVAPAPAKKGGGKVVVILLVVVLVCLILGCIAAFIWVDADKTGARWCNFPFSLIAQVLGAVCQ